jgi:hypothetical protein
VAAPGDVAIHEQGHKGAPGWLWEPVAGQVAMMALLDIEVAAGPGVIADI